MGRRHSGAHGRDPIAGTAGCRAEISAPGIPGCGAGIIDAGIPEECPYEGAR
jgi:hypothetical protein